MYPAAKGDNDTRIFLRADKTVPYGEVMEVMNLLQAVVVDRFDFINATAVAISAARASGC